MRIRINVCIDEHALKFHKQNKTNISGECNKWLKHLHKKWQQKEEQNELKLKEANT